MNEWVRACVHVRMHARPHLGLPFCRVHRRGIVLQHLRKHKWHRTGRTHCVFARHPSNCVSLVGPTSWLSCSSICRMAAMLPHLGRSCGAVGNGTIVRTRSRAPNTHSTDPQPITYPPVTRTLSAVAISVSQVPPTHARALANL